MSAAHDAHPPTRWGVCVCGDGTPENPPGVHGPLDVRLWTTDEVHARSEVILARAQGAPHAHLISLTVHHI